MAYIKVGKENSTDIEIHYRDFGQGKPAVLIHGYPQNGAAWEKQFPAIYSAGYRIIAYDRRGFGESSKPHHGYDYDTFASDLNEVIRFLDLQEITLIGHSMGTGEIARYLSKYGRSRMEKAVFIAPTLPFLLKTDDNPEGLEPRIFDEFQELAAKDRFAYMKQFFNQFYASGLIGHSGVSEQKLQSDYQIGYQASAKAIHDCIAAWGTDFRADLRLQSVPSLIIQGTHDKVLPIEVTGEKLQVILKDSQWVQIEGAPHGLLWTHAEQVNQELSGFLGQSQIRSVA